MSIDLTIRLGGALYVDAVLQAAHDELRNLLGREDVPQITATGLQRGNRVRIASGEIPKDFVLLVGLEPEDWSLELLLQDRGVLTNDEKPDPHAVISVRGAASNPMKPALAAALAIAVAKLANGSIIDDNHTWVAILESSPVEFQHALKVGTRAQCLEGAAEQLVQKMNKSTGKPSRIAE